MFTTGSGRDDADPRSWYGEPQHEEEGGNRWEIEYYGGSSDESPPEPIEFVPEIEHPGTFDEDAGSSDRRTRPLSASD